MVDIFLHLIPFQRLFGLQTAKAPCIHTAFFLIDVLNIVCFIYIHRTLKTVNSYILLFSYFDLIHLCLKFAIPNHERGRRLSSLIQY